MPLNEKGFLGEEIKRIELHLEEEYKDIFSLCYDLNKAIQKLINELNVRKNNDQEVISSSLFIRVINGFQAVVILARYGLTVECKVLMRSILETIFILGAIVQDARYVSDYIKSDEANRLKLINMARSYPDGILDDLRAYATDEITKEIKEKVTVENITELQIWYWAEKAGMKRIYDTMWRDLSGTAHPTPRAIEEEYMIFDEKQEIKSFVIGPSEKDTPKVLIPSVSIVIIALRALITLFKNNCVEELDKFQKINDALSVKYFKN